MSQSIDKTSGSKMTMMKQEFSSSQLGIEGESEGLPAKKHQIEPAFPASTPTDAPDFPISVGNLESRFSALSNRLSPTHLTYAPIASESTQPVAERIQSSFEGHIVVKAEDMQIDGVLVSPAINDVYATKEKGSKSVSGDGGNIVKVEEGAEGYQHIQGVQKLLLKYRVASDVLAEKTGAFETAKREADAAKRVHKKRRDDINKIQNILATKDANGSLLLIENYTSELIHEYVKWANAWKEAFVAFKGPVEREEEAEKELEKATKEYDIWAEKKKYFELAMKGID